MISSLRRLGGLAALLWTGLGTSLALADGATLAPARVDLSESDGSALIRVTNHDAGPRRVALSVYAWDQDADGNAILDPSADLVVFPSTLLVEGGEERRVRVWVQSLGGPRERAYQIVLKELSGQVSAWNRGGVEEAVLLDRAVVFVQPNRQILDGRITVRDRSVDGLIGVDVTNGGTTSFMLDVLRITGLDADGEVTFDAALDGWYVLPGASQPFEIELPAAACLSTSQVLLDAITDRGTWSRTVHTLGPRCLP